jgi:hypothetical protein
MKPVEKLSVDDLSAHPVWEYVAAGDTSVRPVDNLPIDSLRNRVVGTRVRLANATKLWAILSGISFKNRRFTANFLTLSIENDGKWFHLARYFDIDFDKRDPKHLAEFLGLPLSGVFPIEYDISELVSTDPDLAKGHVPLEPQERLSEDELIDLALRG